MNIDSNSDGDSSDGLINGINDNIENNLSMMASNNLMNNNCETYLTHKQNSPYSTSNNKTYKREKYSAELVESNNKRNNSSKSNNTSAIWELDKQKLYEFKDKQTNYKFNNSSFNYNNHEIRILGFRFNRNCFIMTLVLTLIILWIFYSTFFSTTTIGSFSECSGNTCQNQICENMLENRIAGRLCMDLCVTKSINLPQCSQITVESNRTYQYYSLGAESTIVCALSTENDAARDHVIYEGMTQYYFEEAILDLIKSKLDDSPTAEKILENLNKFVDVNSDKKLNYAEAKSLWLLMNNKHTFFMLVFAGKPFVPTLKNFCGSLVETELITETKLFKHDKDSLFNAVFSNTYKWLWPEWNYRCKIGLGILEFFMDIVSFNPNDEFGKDSLYLCSPIETSFGHNFVNEAKLINYNELITSKELEQKLSGRVCKSDLDCVYTDQCSTFCNLETKRCNGILKKPQIVNFCKFAREYLMDNANITSTLEPLLKECESLNTFNESTSLMFGKNEMPLSYTNHKLFIAQSNYWKTSLNYVSVSNRLRTLLWNHVKFAKDPVKATKKTKQQTTVTPR